MRFTCSKIINLIFFLSAILTVRSQEIYSLNTNYNPDFKKSIYLKKYVDKNDTITVHFHTSDKAWTTGIQKDSCRIEDNEYYAYQLSKDEAQHQSWIRRKLFHEDLFTVNEKDFKLAVNPLFNFSLQRTVEDSSHYCHQNTRGLELKGMIGNDLYFETSYYESQSSFVPYVNDYVEQYGVVPGLITVKNFKTTSWDYGTAFGKISYTPIKNTKDYSLNIQGGSDKNFFGDGYRSLLLSDYSSPYPFLKITAVYKRWQYETMYTSFQNIFVNHVLPYDSITGPYQKKTGTFHYLSYYAGNALDISLFEGTLWQVADSGGKRFNPNAYNPVILCNTAENGFGGKNYTLLGLNLMYKAFNKLHFYGQFAADEISLKHISDLGYFHNRYGIQLGAEGFDMFGLHNLNLQAEYNQAQPYMYSADSPSQSYTHYNQPLADPLGANFREAIGILRYNFRRCFIKIQLNYAVYGSDTAKSDWGKNLFASDLHASQTGENKIGQGIRTTMRYADVCLSYLMNPKSNLNIFVGATYRDENNFYKAGSDKFIYIGIRTSLLNEYFDF